MTRALERNGQIAVVAEADNGREALEMIRREAPAVALVDYQMPEMDGIALLREIVRDGLATRVLLCRRSSTAPPFSGPSRRAPRVTYRRTPAERRSSTEF